MEKPTSLCVIEGDYGLISLDIECIEAILYAKLKQISLEIQVQNSIKSCALYTAPSWQSDNDITTRFPSILIKWRQLHGSLDESLTAKEASETLALTNLVTTKLDPAIQFLYWVDPRNNEELINRWFMKALPFPFNYAYTKRKKDQAAQLIETLYPMDTDLDVIKEFITKTTTQCLSTLSTRLGKAQFFFGDNPMVLDVVVYAHIAPLVKLPFPSNDIQSLMTMWPNLTEFVKRIDTKYFPDLKKEVKYLKPESVTKTNDDDVSYTAIFILVVSATSLVVGFAVKKGFIKMPKLF